MASCHYLKLGGCTHLALQQKARRLIRCKKTSVALNVQVRFKGYIAAKKASSTYNLHLESVKAVGKIYQALIQKHSKVPVRYTASGKEGTKSFRTFERVGEICRQQSWITGEYLAAQFVMMPRNMPPLLRHLASPGAIKRFKKFCKMFRNKRLENVVAPSEKIMIERATQASANNLVVLLLARGKATLLDNDFSLFDRYTLAYFYIISMLPKKETYAEVLEEVDNIKLIENRLETIKFSCLSAAKNSMEKLTTISSPYAEPVNKLRREVCLVVNSLYGLND